MPLWLMAEVKAITCAPLEFSIVVVQLPSTPLVVVVVPLEFPPYPPPQAISDKTKISNRDTAKTFITFPFPGEQRDEKSQSPGTDPGPRRKSGHRWLMSAREAGGARSDEPLYLVNKELSTDRRESKRIGVETCHRSVIKV